MWLQDIPWVALHSIVLSGRYPRLSLLYLVVMCSSRVMAWYGGFFSYFH